MPPSFHSTRSTLPDRSSPLAPQNQRRDLSDSSTDTAYNGSEGHIDSWETGFEPENEDYRQSTAKTLSRPALGSRLLSSLSNNTQPAASALTRKGSVLHSRAKSLAQYVPKLNSSGSPSTPARARQAPHRIFNDFFSGESAPIQLGISVSPTREKSQEETEFVMDYRSSLTERPSTSVGGRNAAQHSATTPKKPSWFARKSTPPSTPLRAHASDELASLNINAALFPDGPTDPMQPHAYNDLLLNATSLLQRMQTAYREKTDFIASLQPELDAQREENEEVETRSRHLKLQLEDMGLRAQEQQTTMQDMSRLLAEAKVRAQEAEDALRAMKSVRIVPSCIDSPVAIATPPTRRSKRLSACSASDSGFESDMESVSPDTLPPCSRSSDDDDVWCASPRAPTLALTPPPRPVAFAKPPTAEAAAWSTARGLRDENAALRRRLADMDAALQGCIELVGTAGAATNGARAW